VSDVKRGAGNVPRSSFLTAEFSLPDFGRVADSCSRYERGQHHEEGDPGERNENVSRRIEVTHHDPPGAVGVVHPDSRDATRSAVLECDGRHIVEIPIGFRKSGV
jgi:hypothetical protein